MLYRGKKVVNNFVLNEYNYCRRVMKKYFNSNLIMSAVKNEKFEMTNICWICDGLIENTDNKVRDHCHITGRYRGTAHYGCNMVVKFL